MLAECMYIVCDNQPFLTPADIGRLGTTSTCMQELIESDGRLWGEMARRVGMHKKITTRSSFVKSLCKNSRRCEECGVICHTRFCASASNKKMIRLCAGCAADNLGYRCLIDRKTARAVYFLGRYALLSGSLAKIGINGKLLYWRHTVKVLRKSL